ncbi:transposase family protein [Streptomyces sp. NPDC059816]|uniref:transposase family protein n=1 Tax=Streptomyces sp. NPDC059816 TaxID=3346960 RepID=UPI00365F050F
MVLVWMAKGDTLAQLAAHFGVATDTAWRYVNEGLDALAPLTPTLEQALSASGEERRPLLDGTLIPTRRCTAVATEVNPDPLYSGKHRDHGMNVQALTTTEGELVFLGRARPGSIHDLSAARTASWTRSPQPTWKPTADSRYQGAGGIVRTPIKGPQRQRTQRLGEADELRPGQAPRRHRAPLRHAQTLARTRPTPHQPQPDHDSHPRDLRHHPSTIFTHQRVDRSEPLARPELPTRVMRLIKVPASPRPAARR